MKYSETTESYNERRHGRPWKAIVSTSCTKDFSFIDWEGRNGCEGQFNFEAEPGTLLAYGQKDIRKGHGGVAGYQLCMPDGKLAQVWPCSEVELRKMALADRVVALAKKKIEVAQERLDKPVPEPSKYLDPEFRLPSGEPLTASAIAYNEAEHKSEMDRYAKGIEEAQVAIDRYSAFLVVRSEA